MKLFTRQPSPTEQLKNVAIEAAIRALVDSRDEPKRRSGLSGSRAVAAGAVLYTAAFAAVKGRSLLREQLSAEGREEDEELKAEGRQEQDDETSSEAATPRPKRKPKRRAARREGGAQPSLDLPRQRWPRMPAGRT